MDDYRAVAVKELERLEEDILYTEKAHFAAAEGLQRLHWILGVVATVAAAVTSVSVIADGPPWFSGPVALIAAVFSALITFVKPDEQATQHLAAARILNDVRVQARQHRELDMHSSTPAKPEVWREYADTIRAGKRDADASAPALGQHAFEKGRTKIEGGDFVHAADT